MKWNTVSFGLVAAFACGCGGGTQTVMPGFSEDQKAIGMLVDRVNDDKSTAAVFAKLFAAGAAPKDKKDLAKYPTLFFAIDGPPTVSGETATANVKMVTESGNAEKGSKEWTFVKEAGAWKIKTAPIP